MVSRYRPPSAIPDPFKKYESESLYRGIINRAARDRTREAREFSDTLVATDALKRGSDFSAFPELNDDLRPDVENPLAQRFTDETNIRNPNFFERAIRPITPALDWYDRYLEKPLTSVTATALSAAAFPFDAIYDAARYGKPLYSNLDPNSNEFAGLFSRTIPEVVNGLTRLDADSWEGDLLSIWNKIGEEYSESEAPPYLKGIIELVNPIDPVNVALLALSVPTAGGSLAVGGMGRILARAGLLHARGVLKTSSNIIEKVQGGNIGGGVHTSAVRVDGMQFDASKGAWTSKVQNMTFEEADSIGTWGGALLGSVIRQGQKLPGIVNPFRLIGSRLAFGTQSGRETLLFMTNAQVLRNTVNHVRDYFKVGYVYEGENIVKKARGNFFGFGLPIGKKRNLIDARGRTNAIFEIGERNVVTNLKQNSAFVKKTRAQGGDVADIRFNEVWLFDNFRKDIEVRDALTDSQYMYFVGLEAQIELGRRLLKEVGFPEDVLNKIKDYKPRYVKDGPFEDIYDEDTFIKEIEKMLDGRDLEGKFTKPRDGTIESNMLDGIDYHNPAESVAMFIEQAMKYANTTNWVQQVSKSASKNYAAAVKANRDALEFVSEASDFLTTISGKKNIETIFKKGIDEFSDDHIDGAAEQMMAKYKELMARAEASDIDSHLQEAIHEVANVLNKIMQAERGNSTLTALASQLVDVVTSGHVLGAIGAKKVQDAAMQFGSHRMQQIARDIRNVAEDEKAKLGRSYGRIVRDGQDASVNTLTRQQKLRLLRDAYLREFDKHLKATRTPRNFSAALKILEGSVKEKKLRDELLRRKGISDFWRHRFERIERLEQAQQRLKERIGGVHIEFEKTRTDGRRAGRNPQQEDLIQQYHKFTDRIKTRKEHLQEHIRSVTGEYAPGGEEWFRRSTFDKLDAAYLDSTNIKAHAANKMETMNDVLTTITRSINQLAGAKRLDKLGLDENHPGIRFLMSTRAIISDAWDAKAHRPLSDKMLTVQEQVARLGKIAKRLEDLNKPLEDHKKELQEILKQKKLDLKDVGRIVQLDDTRVPGYTELEDAIKGLFFSAQAKREIQRLISAPDNFLTSLAKGSASVSTAIRWLKSSLDFGIFGIHSLLMLGYRPDTFSRAVAGALWSFVDQTSYHRFARQHSETIQKMIANKGSYGTANIQEYAAFAADNPELAAGRGLFSGIAGDFLSGLAEGTENRRLEKGYRFAGNIVGGAEGGVKWLADRFSVMFNANALYMQVNMFESLEKSWVAAGGDLAGLMDFIDKSIGFMDTTRHGVGLQQQAVERGLLFFAPRYTRASIALVGDVLRGGIKGQEARKAIQAQLAIIPMYYQMAAIALGQEAKMDPRPVAQGGDGAQFLTLEVRGGNIGFGGIYTALARFAADIISTPPEEMTRVINPLKMSENPIMRFWMNRTAPVTQIMGQLFERETYIGEPLESPGDFGKFFTAQVTPFWAENVLLSGGDNAALSSRLIGSAFEFMGARQYPITLWEQLRDNRDLGARQMFGNGEPVAPTYEELNLLQREQVDRNPKYKIQDIQEQLGDKYNTNDGLRSTMDVFFKLVEENKAQLIQGYKQSTAKFEVGIYDSVDFLDSILAVNTQVYGNRELLRADIFNEVREYMDERRKDAILPIEDVAYMDWINQIVLNDALHLPDGSYDHELRQWLEKDFIDYWGEEAFVYVQTIFTERLTEPNFGYPDPLKEWQLGRRVFHWYWDAADAAVLDTAPDPEALQARLSDFRRANKSRQEIMLDNDPELKEAHNRISRIKKKMRERDRVLDIFIHRWYGTTLAHADNQWAEPSKYYRFQYHIDFPYPRYNAVNP